MALEGISNYAAQSYASKSGEDRSIGIGNRKTSNDSVIRELPVDKMISKNIEQVNKKLQQSTTECQFGYDEVTKTITIKMIDSETKEIIREIPPEKTLEMIAKMWELAGILVDERR